MTDEQLATANEFEEYHRQKFEYEKSNVSFKKGFENFCSNYLRDHRLNNINI